MNAFEFALAYDGMQTLVNSISMEAFNLAAKTFGTYPISNTIDELINPSGVNIEDALFCQQLLDCK